MARLDVRTAHFSRAIDISLTLKLLPNVGSSLGGRLADDTAPRKGAESPLCRTACGRQTTYQKHSER